jgi:2-polyprenyl-6-methoxyphenol hydroxylase-like FAD-dependent oxidoreductase
MGAGDVVTVPMPAPSAAELDTTPFRLRGVCAQDRLDAVVAADLARRGADLRWSTLLVGIAQDADGVDVELEGPDGRYSLRLSRVVAADGTHSAVRSALGVGTSGAGDLGKSMINILFRADLRSHLRGMSFGTCTITTPEAPGLLVTVDGETNWVFHVACDVDGGERPEDFTPERCAAVVRSAVGGRRSRPRHRGAQRAPVAPPELPGRPLRRRPRLPRRRRRAHRGTPGCVRPQHRRRRRPQPGVETGRRAQG